MYNHWDRRRVIHWYVEFSWQTYHWDMSYLWDWHTDLSMYENFRVTNLSKRSYENTHIYVSEWHTDLSIYVWEFSWQTYQWEYSYIRMRLTRRSIYVWEFSSRIEFKISKIDADFAFERSKNLNSFRNFKTTHR